MSDNNFDILIRMQAELDGATESVAALKELKRQAVATGVSTGDLDKQIANAERTAGTFQKKIEDAGKKGAGHIEGLHKATHMLARQFGELGHLAMSALSLPALGITALAVGINLAVEHFQKLKEKVEAAAGKIRALDLAQLEAMRTATSSAATSMHQFNLEMDLASHSKDPFHGRKFGSEQEELNERLGKQSGLDSDARTAKTAAAEYGKTPAIATVTKRLADAVAETPALKKAIADAGDVTMADAANAVDEDDLANIVKNRVVAAQAKYDMHLANIAGDQGFADAFANRQATLNSDASEKTGFATGNRGRITSLNESIREADRQRRAGLSDQLQAGGFGLAEANQLVGAASASARMAGGNRATGMDAADYNVMLSQVKAEMSAAFFKSITEAFSDGVATPEEITKIKEYLRNKSARP